MDKVTYDVWTKCLQEWAKPYENGYLVMCTQRDIAGVLKKSVADVNRALRELGDRGKVVMLQKGVYFLPNIVLFKGVE